MGATRKPHRSIRRKLRRLVLVSVGVALAVSAVLNLWHEGHSYIASKRETLLATALVFGAANSKAVAVSDAITVAEGIRGVARVPGLIRAEIEDRHGSLLAESGSAVRLLGDLDLDERSSGSPFRLLTSRTVQVSVPVLEAGEPVGRLTLVSDTGDLLAGFRRTLMIAGTGSALALSIGLLLSHRLQRAITRPLVSLSQAMARVEASKDYGPPIPIETDDETGLLAASFNSMIGTIRGATAELVAREEETILRLSRAAEQRDDHTGEHIVRVATLTRIVAESLGLDAKLTADLYRASPMHDVGKISVPDAILFKPGRLDPEERAKMERHAEAGYEILSGSNSKLVQLAAEIALSHHERWDGTGYPRRLAGEAIPLSGRLTAVADVCDALLAERPYKKAWSSDAVRAHLIKESGTHLDPACVDALLRRWSEVERLYPEAGRGSAAAPANAA